MASSASTLTAAAAAAKYPALSLRQVLECFLVAIQTVPSTATALAAIAATQGYAALSERELQECILAAISGGSGGAGSLSGNGTPTATGAVGTNGQFYTDTSTGNIYAYLNGWQPTGITVP